MSESWMHVTYTSGQHVKGVRTNAHTDPVWAFVYVQEMSYDSPSALLMERTHVYPIRTYTMSCAVSCKRSIDQSLYPYTIVIARLPVVCKMSGYNV